MKSFLRYKKFLSSIVILFFCLFVFFLYLLGIFSFTFFKCLSSFGIEDNRLTDMFLEPFVIILLLTILLTIIASIILSLIKTISKLKNEKLFKYLSQSANKGEVLEYCLEKKFIILRKDKDRDFINFIDIDKMVKSVRHPVFAGYLIASIIKISIIPSQLISSLDEAVELIKKCNSRDKLTLESLMLGISFILGKDSQPTIKKILDIE